VLGALEPALVRRVFGRFSVAPAGAKDAPGSILAVVANVRPRNTAGTGASTRPLEPMDQACRRRQGKRRLPSVAAQTMPASDGGGVPTVRAWTHAALLPGKRAAKSSG